MIFFHDIEMKKYISTDIPSGVWHIDEPNDHLEIIKLLESEYGNYEFSYFVLNLELNLFRAAIMKLR